jgi:hypothetical protein
VSKLLNTVHLDQSAEDADVIHTCGSRACTLPSSLFSHSKASGLTVDIGEMPAPQTQAPPESGFPRESLQGLHCLDGTSHRLPDGNGGVLGQVKLLQASCMGQHSFYEQIPVSGAAASCV